LPCGHARQRCRADLRRQPGLCPCPQSRGEGMNGGDREMSEDPSEEAAWRDLVAHYATPGAADGTPTPWPTREDLPGPGTPGEEEASPDSSGQDTADLDITGLDMASPDDPDADA